VIAESAPHHGARNTAMPYSPQSGPTSYTGAHAIRRGVNATQRAAQGAIAASYLFRDGQLYSLIQKSMAGELAPGEPAAEIKERACTASTVLAENNIQYPVQRFALSEMSSGTAMQIW
jgi:hypothetical protein